jgi:hypothetical protein
MVVRGQLHADYFTSRGFVTRGKSPWYAMDMRLVGPQGKSRLQVL